MTMIKSNFVAISLLTLMMSAPAEAAVSPPTVADLMLSYADQNPNYSVIFGSDYSGTIDSYGALLGQVWSGYGAAANFYGAIDSLFPGLNSAWHSQNNLVFIANNDSVGFNIQTGQYTIGGTTTSVPGPVAGAGILPLLMIASVALLAYRKRKASDI